MQFFATASTAEHIRDESWPAGVVVRARRMTFEERGALQAHMAVSVDESGKIEAQRLDLGSVHGLQRQVLQTCIVDWTLPDPEHPGQIMPCTPESIALLDADIASYLYQRISALGQRSEDERQDFTPAAATPSST